MSSNDIALQNLQDLTAKVVTAPLLADTSGLGTAIAGYPAPSRVVLIYSEEDLEARIKGMTPPFCGAVYEGFTPYPEGTKMSHRMGAAGDCHYSLLLVVSSDGYAQGDFKSPAINLLGQVRKTLFDSKGSSGHTWRFGGEVKAIQKPAYAVWVQRWFIPTNLLF